MVHEQEVKHEQELEKEQEQENQQEQEPNLPQVASYVPLCVFYLEVDISATCGGHQESLGQFSKQDNCSLKGGSK